MKYLKDRVDIVKNIADKKEEFKEWEYRDYIKCKCNRCGYESSKMVGNLLRRGYSCSRCGDHISFGEKIMMSLLEINNVEYIEQYKIDVKRLNVDFYLPYYNTIIEIQGRYHYSKQNVIDSDKKKKEYCNSKGISLAEIEYLTSSITTIIEGVEKNKNINKLLPNKDKEEIIQQMKKHVFNNDFNILEDYNKGMTYKNITDKYGIKRATLRGVLQRYDYFHREHSNPVKVICVTTNKVYPSKRDAAKNFNTYSITIDRCCKNKDKYVAYNDKKYYWRYYNE